MLALGTVLAFALATSGCNPKEAARGGDRREGKPGRGDAAAAGGKARRAQKVAVEVRRVQSYPVEYAIDSVGSVQAFEKIQVVARVAGVVDTLSFEEGTKVTREQKLAAIDPERFQLAVSAGRASLAKAVAGQHDAQSALERRNKLTKMSPGMVSAEELGSAAGRVDVLTAEVEQAKVALQIAELDLKESDVRSPVDGIIQSRLVQTGQFVQRGATLATLLRRDPMLLKFNVPGTEAARLHTGMTVRFVVPGVEPTLSAVISHVAAAADPASRMVEITGRISDPNRELLKPGSFAEVTVPVDSQSENPVIPLAAVRPSERGFLAFVFQKGVARERILKLGLRTTGGQVEVRSGITPGEMLIVRGTEAVREGAEVEVEQPKPASPSSGPPATPSAGPSPEASPAASSAASPAAFSEPVADSSSKVEGGASK